MSHTSEFEQLLKRAGEGERAALELLYNKYYDHICRVITRRLNQLHIQGSVRASDIFNDVMLHILEHPGELETYDEQHLLRYALKVAGTHICDVLRQLAALRRDFRRLAMASTSESEIEDPHPGPAETAERNELLKLAYQRLGSMDRLILTWRDDGVTWPEIGHRLGITSEAARKQFARITERLTQRFAGNS